jgi:hypothetical protein
VTVRVLALIAALLVLELPTTGCIVVPDHDRDEYACHERRECPDHDRPVVIVEEHHRRGG